MVKKKNDENVGNVNTEEEKTSFGDIEIGSPEIYRPKELPFIVKKKGGWDNEAQEKYAGVLNAYAYKNPDKFEKKKGILVAQLEEIGKDPDAIFNYNGIAKGEQPPGELTYKNKLVES